MTHILHRAANAVMPVAVAGKGVELFDRDGKSYIDASGGAAVSCLGHGHPDILTALHEQLDRLAYAHTAFFTTEVAEQLADRLIEDAPAGLDHVYLVSGGSEAVEAALKELDHKLGDILTAWLVCPHVDDDKCGCRKPKGGMITELAELYGVDLDSSTMVGDQEVDRQAGEAAGVGKFVFAKDFFGWK